jgi:ABC transport system ATP-binding/permease protein
VSHDRAFLDNIVTSLLVLEGDGRVQDFVGGYSDWARWRDARNAARTADARALPARSGAGDTQPAAPQVAAAKPARKLSYKEQRELASLPAKLEELETLKAQLHQQASDPAFYSRPHAEVAAQLARLAEIDAQIETTFARWSQLESA